MSDFKVGDCVMLGGNVPRMAIESISADGLTAICSWIYKTKKHSDTFVIAALRQCPKAGVHSLR